MRYIILLFLTLQICVSEEIQLTFPAVTGLDSIDFSQYRNVYLTEYKFPTLSSHYGKTGRLNSVFITVTGMETESILMKIDKLFLERKYTGSCLLNKNERIINIGGEYILIEIWDANYEITNDQKRDRTISDVGNMVVYSKDQIPKVVSFGKNIVFLCSDYIQKNGSTLTSCYYKK